MLSFGVSLAFSFMSTSSLLLSLDAAAASSPLCSGFFGGSSCFGGSTLGLGLFMMGLQVFSNAVRWLLKSTMRTQGSSYFFSFCSADTCLSIQDEDSSMAFWTLDTSSLAKW